MWPADLPNLTATRHPCRRLPLGYPVHRFATDPMTRFALMYPARRFAAHSMTRFVLTHPASRFALDPQCRPATDSSCRFAIDPACCFARLKNRPAAERSACLCPNPLNRSATRPAGRKAAPLRPELVLVAVSSHPPVAREEPGAYGTTMVSRGSTKMFCDMF